MNDESVKSVTPQQLVAAYCAGAPEQAGEFDFLTGDWDARGRRHGPDGAVVFEYAGRWHAEYLRERRMVFDHFTACLDDGTDFSFFATLRTYCTFTEQWEMTFLTAMQPYRLKRFTGRRVGDEMHLEGLGTDLSGRVIESRVRFFGISTNAFSWEQVSRMNGRADWVLEATIEATRAN